MYKMVESLECLGEERIALSVDGPSDKISATKQWVTSESLPECMPHYLFFKLRDHKWMDHSSDANPEKLDPAKHLKKTKQNKTVDEPMYEKQCSSAKLAF